VYASLYKRGSGLLIRGFWVRFAEAFDPSNQTLAFSADRIRPRPGDVRLVVEVG
jgi:hypothetical protein